MAAVSKALLTPQKANKFILSTAFHCQGIISNSLLEVTEAQTNLSIDCYHKLAGAAVTAEEV